MIRRPPRSTQGVSSAASDVYKRQYQRRVHGVDIVIIFFVGILLITGRNIIAGLFSDEPEVLGYLTNLLILLAVVEFFDSIQCVCGGIVKGIGKQAIATCASLASYYVIMQPVALLLAFYFELGVYGFWIGNSIGQLSAMIFYAGIILSQDWREVVEDAQFRLNQELSRVEEKNNSINFSNELLLSCLLYTSPSPRDLSTSRMPSSA
eukprot:TRINITY_DN66349_c0_g1_i1.p1 TRINITY_DN66349_c0_g1~~TRINITY_DN66349_c0_g1_i1.p1  ORF type:complete len:207 (+),score=46.81 TRINITY_DN66349_c0_g1_i1:103-723(+)